MLRPQTAVTVPQRLSLGTAAMVVQQRRIAEAKAREREERERVQFKARPLPIEIYGDLESQRLFRKIRAGRAEEAERKRLENLERLKFKATPPPCVPHMLTTIGPHPGRWR